MVDETQVLETTPGELVAEGKYDPKTGKVKAKEFQTRPAEIKSGVMKIPTARQGPGFGELREKMMGIAKQREDIEYIESGGGDVEFRFDPNNPPPWLLGGDKKQNIQENKDA